MFAEEDKLSLHRFKSDEAYRIGHGLGPVEAYLSIPEIMRVARQSGADAIHPGYGLLSENPEFADACGRGGHCLHRSGQRNHAAARRQVLGPPRRNRRGCPRDSGNRTPARGHRGRPPDGGGDRLSRSCSRPPGAAEAGECGESHRPTMSSPPSMRAEAKRRRHSATTSASWRG